MDATTALISPETRWFSPVDPFVLESGMELRGVRVAYRTWGRLAAPADNAIMVCHPLTASADVEAWWEGLLGAGHALDPQRDYVVCSNLLGSCYGTTGPASLDSDTGRRRGSNFPAVTIGDMVRLQRQLARYLGVRRLALVIGGSLGGMLTLEWAVRYPEMVGAVVSVATAARQPAWAIGMSEAQRQAIAADPRWCGGDYLPQQSPDAGLAAARAMAMLSYRHWNGFAQRFAREHRPDGTYEVESYLRYQGWKFVHRFDAASYVVLTRAMDGFDLAVARGGNMEGILSSVQVPALVVSVDSDLLYPIQEQAFLARHLPNAEHAVLHSVHGHDGFLIETEQLDGFIREFRRRRAAPDRAPQCLA